MSETMTNHTDDKEWTHPIPSDIVTDVAEEHDIRTDLLNRILEEGSKSWDGHREDLERIFEELHFGGYGYRFNQEAGYMVVWGGSYHPRYLLRDVHLPDYVAECHGKASVPRFLLAVTQAHRRRADQLCDIPSEATSPVVIQRFARE